MFNIKFYVIYNDHITHSKWERMRARENADEGFESALPAVGVQSFSLSSPHAGSWIRTGYNLVQAEQ
jgi:hypothetical protein